MDQIKLEELAVAYPDQEDLVQVYKEWGNKEQVELDEFGKHARQFILENKNSEIQAKRLMNFIMQH